MAGIGFRLRELARQETFWSSLQVYVSSSLIASGPWIITMVNLFVISLWNPGRMDDVDRATLFCIVSYAMAASFLLTGVFTMAFTRFLADQVYVKREDQLLPSLNGFLLILLPIAAISGYWFLYGMPLHAFVKFLALLLYFTLTVLWVMMAYLSLLHDYGAIVWAFLGGAVGGWIMAFGVAESAGLGARLLGFLAGQLLTVGALAFRLFKELGSETGVSFEFIKSWKSHWRLLGIGLFYNLGIWIDKGIFWTSPYRLNVNGFYVCPFYDTALFFAQLTMLPTITLFIVHIETEFYEKYAAFYRDAIAKQPLRSIHLAKEHIKRTVRGGLESLLHYQGAATLLALVFSGRLTVWLHLDPAQAPLLRISILGAFLQSLSYVFLIFLLYFDRQGEALRLSFVFALGVGGLTYWTLHHGFATLGYGYFTGCLLALIVGYLAMDRTLKNLEFNTFARQPMAKSS